MYKLSLFWLRFLEIQFKQPNTKGKFIDLQNLQVWSYSRTWGRSSVFLHLPSLTVSAKFLLERAFPRLQVASDLISTGIVIPAPRDPLSNNP